SDLAAPVGSRAGLHPVTTARLGAVAPVAAGPLASVGAHLRRLSASLESAGVRVRTSHDGEAIHDLRVASRRMTAVLSTWRGAWSPRAVRRAGPLLPRLRGRPVRPP